MTGSTARLPVGIFGAWNTDRFALELKQALERLPAGTLPLGRAGPNGGAVDDSRIVVTVLDCSSTGEAILAEVGVFYQEIVAGCSCGEEPMPLPAYARIRVHLEPASGTARFVLSED